MHNSRKKKVKRMVDELLLMAEQLEGVISQERTIFEKLDTRNKILRGRNESDLDSLDISRVMINDVIEELSKTIYD